jgi:hypothetical protein
MSTRLALQRTVRLAALSTAILAAGCGGGGDGGSTPPVDTTPPPAALLQITAQNQDAVARAAIATFFSMTGVRALPTGGASAKASSVDGAVVHAFSKLPRQGDGPRVGRFAVASQSMACSVSGSVTMTVDDRDNNMALSAGDVLTLSFSSCRDEPEVMLNGALTVAISGYSETTNAMQMSGSFAYQQLTLIDHGYTSAINGAMNATFSESIDAMGTLTSRIEATVAASGLMATGAQPGYNETFTYDPGFATTLTDVSGAPPMIAAGTTLCNGTVHVASLNGRITLATDAASPVHQRAVDAYPDTGRVRVTGQGSLLQLTVMDSTMVRIELDLTNDGVFDTAKDMAWTTLMP